MYLKERVVLNKMIGHPAQRLYMLVLSGQIAANAQPGQFVHIQVSQTGTPLLRRPLSIALINQQKEEITIYYRVQGRGTELLSQIKKDEYVSIIGPLGSGFTVPREGNLLLVAGGIGIFPLFSLLQQTDLSKVDVQFFWGGENKVFLESAGLDLLKMFNVPYEVATMDGSLGSQGLVTELLLKALQGKIKEKNSVEKIKERERKTKEETEERAETKAETKADKEIRAAACGPDGMLETTARICQAHGLLLEVSLEERMACGIGACLGCICTVRDEQGNLKRKRVCKDGPVFKGKEVVWDAGI